MATLGEWVTVDVGLPQEIRDVANSINAAANLVNSLLSIGLQIGNLIKAGSVGYLDPIQALLTAVINEINNYIKDLGEIGFFLAGDWNLVTYPFEDLLGGYNAYERRMVARFLNKDDPTRPNISSSSKAVAFFFYGFAADATNVNKILEAVKIFTQLLNKQTPQKKSLPVPVNLQAKYGIDGASIFDFRNLKDFWAEGLSSSPPTTVRIDWTISAQAQKDPAIPFVKPAPQGFVVEVSTVKDGLSIYYERPQNDSKTVTGNRGKKVQVREHGAVLDPDGKPLVVYGGAEAFKLDPTLGFNAVVDANGNIRKGGKRLYARRTPNDASPIPLEMLSDGDTYYLQKTFFVTQTENTWFPGTGYGITIKKEDLPVEAVYTVGSDGKVTVKEVPEAPSTYYVRVYAVSNKITATKFFQYKISADTINTPGKPVKAIGQVSGGVKVETGTDKGEPSTALTLNFPNADSQKYVDTITIALLVLYLSRSDHPVVDEATFLGGKFNVAATKTGLEGVGSLIKRLYTNSDFKFKEKGGRPRNFRSDLVTRCRLLANQFYQSLGPMPELEKSVIQRTALLREWKWTDSPNAEFKTDWSIKDIVPDEMTILDAFDVKIETDGGEEDYGVALNPWSVGSPETIVERDFFLSDLGIINAVQPGFYLALVEAQKLAPTYTEEEAKKFLQTNQHMRVFFKAIKGRQTVREKGRDVSKVIYRVPDAYRRGAIMLKTSATFSPVFYVNQDNLISGGAGGRIFYCRNLFPPEIYAQALLTLNLAGAAFKNSSADGEWIAGKLFIAIPELQQFFKIISLWANTMKTGTKAVTSAIQQYIDFLEARIIEVQELINRLNALIQSILQWDFPSVNGLVVVEDGSAGILSAFIGAANKPSDGGGTAYGAGAVLLSGGAPSFLIDLLGG